MTNITRLMDQWVDQLNETDKEALSDPKNRLIAVRNFELFVRDVAREKAEDRAKKSRKTKQTWRNGGRMPNGITVKRCK